VLVFLSLDAAAAACVLLTAYCAWRGEPAGVFGLLVWCFALGSAFANWRHSSAPGAAPDAAWFFPTMSLAGPALLEAVLGRFRRWAQRDRGRRAKPTPPTDGAAGPPAWARHATPTAPTAPRCSAGIDTVEESIAAYHTLCPDGSLRIATALRRRHNQARDPKPALGDVSAAGEAPAALARRIPVRPEAYLRWLEVWNELRRNGGADLRALAARHDLSVRQVEFIRSAGKAHLLESPVPPARPG
jgi:hypothetical protein